MHNTTGSKKMDEICNTDLGNTLSQYMLQCLRQLFLALPDCWVGRNAHHDAVAFVRFNLEVAGDELVRDSNVEGVQREDGGSGPQVHSLQLLVLPII